MHRHVSLVGGMVAALLLAGCGSPHTTVLGDEGSFSIRDGRVVLRSNPGQEAEIGADGTFAVDGKPVLVTDGQRATLTRYHAAALKVIEHAAATGKAGAEVGVAAVGEVARGLASGDTSQIGAKIEAKADGVRQAAAKICEDLVEVVGLQSTLVTQMEVFRPFAVVKSRQIADCHKGIG
jgi:hypothetical protein